MNFAKGLPRPGFPEHLIEQFFLHGFRRSGSQEHDLDPSTLSLQQLCASYDVRGILYFLILAFGALRSCEPLHFFLCDISFDFWRGAGAIFWIFDPETGGVPQELGTWKDREAYLKSEYGLLPRTIIKGQQHAGFKDLLLDETRQDLGRCTRVHWVVPEIGQLAWYLTQAYISHVRPRSQSHPYLFSSIWGEAYGAPWTLDAVNRTFRQALGRIGETPSSSRGVSMHGFRHRIMHWMRLRDVVPEIRQLVLHHKSMESQRAYGRPTADDVACALETALGSSGRAVGGASYAELFPLIDRTSHLDEIGRRIAANFLRSIP